jgi:hypothetical protein
MSKPLIYFLVKTFSEQSHADQFLDGLLYMNSLDYFIRLEESDSSGRGDRHEGVNAWLQPNEIQLEINGICIDSADLAGPVSIQPTRHLAKNIFCMHAGYIGGNVPSEFATTDEFEEVLKIPQQNISLGKHSMVITNVKEFFQRVKAAASKQNVALSGRLVNYYDPNSFHGHFAEEEAPFNKQIRFAHQREYRLVVNQQSGDVSPYALRVGNLHDIAHAVSIEELNDGIKISPLDR